MKWLNLALGGVAGTFARYFFSGVIYRLCGTDFPYGTLAVNLLGCFLIGVFSVLADEKFILGPDAKLLLMAGFCGAFTTFSTLIFESSNLIRDGETWRALVNVLLSAIAGFLLFRAGVVAARLI